MSNFKCQNKKNGFSIIEILISIFIFCLVGVSVYATFDALVRVSKRNSARINALAVLNEQIEIIRNLPYDFIGVAGGIPNGILPPSKTITKNNVVYTASFTVRNIDDPYDGTIGGSPADSSSAPDYKKVELQIICDNCPNNPPIIISTNVARKGLEMSSLNGALFVQVLGASGNPVPQANVHITNSDVSPAIDFTDLTGNDGFLKIIDVPPSIEKYHIIVSKNGYTTATTLPRDPVLNPNPIDVDASVSAQQLTQKTLFIDLLSNLTVQTFNQACSAVGNISLNLKGLKLIGTSPDVLKYNHDFSTNSSGILNLLNMEWDTYTATINSASFDLAGMIPLLPINLLPNANQTYKFILTPASANNLLVTVKNGSGLLLSGASVRLYKTGYNETLITGRGYLSDSDWSGGSGQTDFVDITKYFSDNGNVDTTSASGNISLKINPTTNRYLNSGYLISSTFDSGASSNFVKLQWASLAQPPETGVDSVKFQIATNNDNASWNFVGPDGTDSSFYTAGNSDITGHNGQRYIRFKILFSTVDDQFSPLVSDVSIGFTDSCAPPGQAFFGSLGSGNYNLEVNLTGFQAYVDAFDISGKVKKEVILLP